MNSPIKISTAILALLGFFSTPGSAHTMGAVKFTCPIDQTAFKAMQDFSGTSFGAQLDLKKIGPIAQPSKLAQCPKCHLPLYKETFVKETKDTTSYFTLGVIQEELKDPPYEIAWAYLQASWQVESDKDKYAAVCKRAVAWFDKSAAALERGKDKKDDYLISKYLPIELARRSEDFADATRRLNAFPKTTGTEIKWLDDTLKYQATLVKNKDATPHELSETNAPKP